jgi:hypothetical protein
MPNPGVHSCYDLSTTAYLKRNAAEPALDLAV